MEENIFSQAIYRQGDSAVFWKGMGHQFIYPYNEANAFHYEAADQANAWQAILKNNFSADSYLIKLLHFLLIISTGY